MSLAASPIEPPYRSNSVSTTHEGSSSLPLIIIIAAFTVLCLPLAYYLNIWQDEAYSLHSSSGTIAFALHQGLGFEAQAPLYFVVLAAWRELNGSAYFARLLSICFSILTLVATWSFARRYLTKLSPWLVVAAIALNPFVVWAAVEIRPYAASVTFSALLLLLLFRGFIDDEPSRAARVSYLCVAVAGTYTQYYVAFLLVAHFVALLALKRWKSTKRFFLYSIVFGLSLLPLLPVLPSQFESYHVVSLVNRVPSYVMATVLFGYPFPHDWIEGWAQRPVENLGYLVLTLVPLAFAWRHLARMSNVTKALLAMSAALLLTYTAVIVVAHVHVIIPRHTLVMLVPMLATMFALIGDVSESRRWIVLGSYTAIYSVFAGCSLWHDFHEVTKVGDWHRVADFVAVSAKPGDAITLFNAEAELPFRYYFKKPAQVAAIPRSMSFERFDDEAFVLHSRHEVAQTFGRFAAKHRHVWLIETEACSPKYAVFGCKYLTSYVDDHFSKLRTVHFNGTNVIELERR